MRLESQDLEGFAHEGMLTAAQRLGPNLAPAVKDGIERLRARQAETPQASSINKMAGVGQRPAKIIVCGHSLGAGVASLLASEWREHGLGTGMDEAVPITCFAFACPQVLSRDLAQSMDDFCYSVVLGDDAVPRLSLATACDLRESVILLSSDDQQQATDHDLVAAQARSLLPDNIQRLYPPGQLYYLRATVEGPDNHAYLLESSDIEELIISSDMLASHMPHRYLAAVSNVEEADTAGECSVHL
mmetsp:Transcript_958/g.4043  ORF Transcript_958/g.4043 Transcript_958/m.4043 type:complete len:245 (+) Transcript_958:1082-1816(+)